MLTSPELLALFAKAYSTNAPNADDAFNALYAEHKANPNAWAGFRHCVSCATYPSCNLPIEEQPVAFRLDAKALLQSISALADCKIPMPKGIDSFSLCRLIEHLFYWVCRRCCTHKKACSLLNSTDYANRLAYLSGWLTAEELNYLEINW